MRKFPPREGDLPRDELCRRAEIMVDEAPCQVNVLFKFTCEHCGERCTLQEPNKLYEEGECFKCGHKTKIEVGGFTLQYLTHIPKPQPKDN